MFTGSLVNSVGELYFLGTFFRIRTSRHKKCIQALFQLFRVLTTWFALIELELPFSFYFSAKSICLHAGCETVFVNVNNGILGVVSVVCDGV